MLDAMDWLRLSKELLPLFKGRTDLRVQRVGPTVPTPGEPFCALVRKDGARFTLEAAEGDTGGVPIVLLYAYPTMRRVRLVRYEKVSPSSPIETGWEIHSSDGVPFGYDLTSVTAPDLLDRLASVATPGRAA